MPVLTARKEEPIPVGEYGLRVVGVQEVDGKFGRQFEWRFELVGKKQVEQYGEKQFRLWSSTSDSLKGNFMKWTAAIYNRAVHDGEPVDSDKFAGRNVMGVIITEEKDGETYNKIQNLKPYVKGQPMPLPDAQTPGDGSFESGVAEHDSEYGPFAEE